MSVLLKAKSTVRFICEGSFLSEGTEDVQKCREDTICGQYLSEAFFRYEQLSP
jgi:hypothetical protein